MGERFLARVAVACLVVTSMLLGAPARADAAPVPAPAPEPAAATCTSSEGPGIPAPPVSGGVPGFHAQWYGQSGYPTLCPGDRSTATVAYYNSGSAGWVRERLG